jgi:hypothetical protein
MWLLLTCSLELVIETAIFIVGLLHTVDMFSYFFLINYLFVYLFPKFTYLFIYLCKVYLITFIYSFYLFNIYLFIY